MHLCMHALLDIVVSLRVSQTCQSATSVVRKYAMQWGFNDAYEGAPFIGFVGTSAIKDWTYVWSVVRDPLARFESAFRTTHGDQLRRQLKAFEKTHPQGTAQQMFRNHYRYAHIRIHIHMPAVVTCTHTYPRIHMHMFRDHYQAAAALVCKASAGWHTDADERPPTDANVLSDVDKHARHAHPAHPHPHPHTLTLHPQTPSNTLNLTSTSS